MAPRMTLRQEILMAFGCGAVVGGVVGYYVGGRRLEEKYRQIADMEIISVKEHYRAKEGELLELQREIAEQPKPDLEEIVRQHGYALPEDHDKWTPEERKAIADAADAEEEEESETEEESVFVELPGWNYDREVAGRTEEVPFIMHLEEYQQSECSHQITITYFEGDDVLVDESDEVISKKDETVGLKNLERFGFGSGDPNVVYVRNPKLDIEYEILRHRGHYSKEILGLEEDPAIEHSAMPRRRPKFDDDR